MISPALSFLFFFFNDTATTEIYTLSLHDALPILRVGEKATVRATAFESAATGEVSYVGALIGQEDRKSTRLNSSHSQISYAVFCLKKKKRASNNTPAHTGETNTPNRQTSYN